jgi:hypothetical protein
LKYFQVTELDNQYDATNRFDLSDLLALLSLNIAKTVMSSGAINGSNNLGERKGQIPDSKKAPKGAFFKFIAEVITSCQVHQSAC